MPDEELLRFELRRAVEVAVRELPEIYRAAGDPSRSRGAHDGGGQHAVEGEGPDAQVAPASRPVAAAGTSAGVRVGSDASPSDAGIFIDSVLSRPSAQRSPADSRSSGPRVKAPARSSLTASRRTPAASSGWRARPPARAPAWRPGSFPPHRSSASRRRADGNHCGSR